MSTSQGKKNKPKNRNWLWIILGICGALLLLFLIAFLWLMGVVNKVQEKAIQKQKESAIQRHSQQGEKVTDDSGFYFFIDKPEGWKMFEEKGMTQFIPESKTSKNTDIRIHINTPKKVAGVSLEDYINEDVDLVKELAPSSIVKELEPLTTANDKEVLTRALYNPDVEKYEYVAYIEEKDKFVVITLNTSSREKYVTSKKMFGDFVLSYRPDSSDSEDGWKVYEDKELSIAFNYPSGWVIKEGPEKVNFYNPADNNLPKVTLNTNTPEFGGLGNWIIKEKEEVKTVFGNNCTLMILEANEEEKMLSSYDLYRLVLNCGSTSLTMYKIKNDEELKTDKEIFKQMIKVSSL